VYLLSDDETRQQIRAISNDPRLSYFNLVTSNLGNIVGNYALLSVAGVPYNKISGRDSSIIGAPIHIFFQIGCIVHFESKAL